ncbi:MAG TPA: BamA/TamA family outer membrane protein [Anaeromyxobacter sp.]|nr:BamA/TamA family outer membrane protein [Anaeromyxobacter sp.]
MPAPHQTPRWPLVAALLAAAPAISAAAEGAAPEPAPTPLAARSGDASGLDDRDLLEVTGLRNPAGRAEPEPGKLMMFVLPAFALNPSVGVAVGAAASAAIALGSPQETTVSSMSASVMVTTKQQIMSSVKTVILTAGNTWELLGDVRLYIYSEPTYGLGTGTTPVSGGFQINGIQTAALPGEQPMDFDYLKVHETVFRKITGPYYLGVGYHLDRYADIQDLALDLNAFPPAVTSHYAYSLAEGFDPRAYNLSGVSLNALVESRDHTLCAYRGVFAQLSWRVNPTWLGSSRPSSLLYAELRTYLPLSEERPRHGLAFWAIAQGVMTGKVPYLDLPALGYDTRGRSGRGYAAGRFRGTSLAYGEVEYRFPLTRNGVLGGVIFANATTAGRPALDRPDLGVHDPGVKLFHAIEPAGGAGLRVMADRQARMNVTIDYAFGVGGSSGLYLSMGETF